MSAERPPPTMTHDEMVAKWMQDPEFKTEYERIRLLAARKAAGSTQAQVAERMGAKARVGTFFVPTRE